MSKAYLYYLSSDYLSQRQPYYLAMLRLMDYIDMTDNRASVIYILNLEQRLYKIYDKDCVCIFSCDVKKPKLLLERIIELLPKKIVLLNTLEKGISRTLLLLFDCIGEL